MDEELRKLLSDLFGDVSGCNISDCVVCPKTAKKMLRVCQELNATKKQIGSIIPYYFKERIKKELEVIK